MAKYFKIKVIPRSSKNEIVGEMADGTLKVKITSPPVDGEANETLRDFLAQEWQIPKNSICIVGGKKGRHKLLEIQENNEKTKKHS